MQLLPSPSASLIDPQSILASWSGRADRRDHPHQQQRRRRKRPAAGSYSAQHACRGVARTSGAATMCSANRTFGRADEGEMHEIGKLDDGRPGHAERRANGGMNDDVDAVDDGLLPAGNANTSAAASENARRSRVLMRTARSLVVVLLGGRHCARAGGRRGAGGHARPVAHRAAGPVSLSATPGPTVLFHRLRCAPGTLGPGAGGHPQHGHAFGPAGAHPDLPRTRWARGGRLSGLPRTRSRCGPRPDGSRLVGLHAHQRCRLGPGQSRTYESTAHRRRRPRKSRGQRVQGVHRQLALRADRH